MDRYRDKEVGRGFFLLGRCDMWYYSSSVYMSEERTQQGDVSGSLC